MKDKYSPCYECKDSTFWCRVVVGCERYGEHQTRMEMNRQLKKLTEIRRTYTQDWGVQTIEDEFEEMQR